MGQPKFMDAHAPTRRRLSPFDVARSILCKGKTQDDRETAHLGSNLMPLFVQQNYLNLEGVKLEAAVRASEAIALGDVVDGTLWGTREWSLLPVQGVMTTGTASRLCQGTLSSVELPKLLENVSTANHRRREAV